MFLSRDYMTDGDLEKRIIKEYPQVSRVVLHASQGPECHHMATCSMVITFRLCRAKMQQKDAADTVTTIANSNIVIMSWSSPFPASIKFASTHHGITSQPYRNELAHNAVICEVTLWWT